jgi:phosphatidylglycerophosphate synthase
MADGLTLIRALLAALLIGTVATGRLVLAACMLAAAWITDALDGRLARASSRATHLGGLDLAVDTAVGACLLTGMTLYGTVSEGLAVVLLVVLGGGFLASKNAALSMALQAVAYAWFLLTLWDEGLRIRWLPLGVVTALFLIELRRLTTVVVPTFLSDLVSLVRAHHSTDRAE